MNENIDLTKILKDCPKGTKLYSSTLGDVTLIKIYKGGTYPIIVDYNEDGVNESFTADGKIVKDKGECTLFPSKEQRNWSKFNAPWSKKERYDPKTLNEFDKVICQNGINNWRIDFFSYYNEDSVYPNVCVGGSYQKCIPYNEETKHLLKTKGEAPEYYRYWEDEL